MQHTYIIRYGSEQLKIWPKSYGKFALYHIIWLINESYGINITVVGDSNFDLIPDTVQIFVKAIRETVR